MTRSANKRHRSISQIVASVKLTTEKSALSALLQQEQAALEAQNDQPLPGRSGGSLLNFFPISSLPLGGVTASFSPWKKIVGVPSRFVDLIFASSLRLRGSKDASPQRER
jgi:hypothetical protein